MVHDEWDELPPAWRKRRLRLGGRQRALLWMGLAGGLTLGALWALPHLGVGGTPQVVAEDVVPAADVSAQLPSARLDPPAVAPHAPALDPPSGAPGPTASAVAAVASAAATPTIGAPVGAALPAGATVRPSSGGNPVLAAAPSGTGAVPPSARVASARHTSEPASAESPSRPAGAAARAASVPSAAPRAAAESDEAEESDGPESTLDVAAAQQGLDEAARASAGCKSENGPVGVARVIVSFAPSGRAAAVSVVGSPFAGTLEGECIAAKFRAIQVPEFTGDRVTMYRSVKIR